MDDLSRARSWSPSALEVSSVRPSQLPAALPSFPVPVPERILISKIRSAGPLPHL